MRRKCAKIFVIFALLLQLVPSNFMTITAKTTKTTTGNVVEVTMENDSVQVITKEQLRQMANKQPSLTVKVLLADEILDDINMILTDGNDPGDTQISLVNGYRVINMMLDQKPFISGSKISLKANDGSNLHKVLTIEVAKDQKQASLTKGTQPYEETMHKVVYIVNQEETIEYVKHGEMPKHAPIVNGGFWTKDGPGGNAIVPNQTPIYEDTKFVFHKGNKEELITITFDPANGTIDGSSDKYEQQIYKNNSLIDNQIPTPIPNDSRQVFMGWSLQEDESNTQDKDKLYTNEDIAKLIFSANATFVAIYQNTEKEGWHFIFAQESSNVEVFYSEDGKTIQQMQKGRSHEVIDENGYVEFFVKVPTGYSAGTQFLHHNASTMEGLDATTGEAIYRGGIYTPIHSFKNTQARELAIEKGCTTAFFYSQSTPNLKYREFKIAAKIVNIQVKYDLNGGTSVTPITDQNVYHHPDTNVKENIIKVSEQTPTRPGYVFKGWKLQDEDKIYHAHDEIQVKDVWKYENDYDITYTFTALWEPLHAYKVHYDLQGGLYENNASIADEIVQFDDIVNIGYRPMRKGYTFDGWYYKDTKVASKTAYQTLVQNDEEVKEITLVAKWIKDDTQWVRITFQEGEHGKLMNNPFTENLLPNENGSFYMEVLKGTNWTDHNYQMPLIIADHGYDVADPAWKSNDEKYTFEEYVQGKVAFYQDVTFIAQYKELAYVTIQYSITDKDGKPIVDEEGNVLSVGKLSLETEQVNPVIGQPAGSKVVYDNANDDYVFAYWLTPNQQKVYDFEIMPTQKDHVWVSETYKAVFLPDENHNGKPDENEVLSMYYDANGGSGSVIDEMMYHVKDQVLIKDNDFTYPKENVIFIGWSKQPFTVILADGKVPQEMLQPKDSFAIMETTTLYAVWAMDENGNHIPDYQESLSMNYDANGGSGSVIDEMTYHVKDQVLVKDNVFTHPKENVIFIGWSKQPLTVIPTDGKAPQEMLQPKDYFTIMETTTLYAVWAMDENGNHIPDYQEERFTVTFIAGEHGKLLGTTTYKNYLVKSAIHDAQHYKEPTPVAEDGYVFDKWVIVDKDGHALLEVAEPGAYVIHGDTIVKAVFAKDDNHDGIPDEREEKLRVNFVVAEHGALEGTTQYNEVLANTKLKNVIDYQTPKPKGAAGYTFDKWIVKTVSNKEGIEIKDPSEYTITENTVFYAYFAKDEHGTDPIHPDHGDGIPDKYQVEVNYEVKNGTLVGTRKTYVTLYDENNEPSQTGNGQLTALQIPLAIADKGYDQSSLQWYPVWPEAGMKIKEKMTFKAKFETADYQLTIRYVDEDGNRIAEDYQTKIAYLNRYEITSPHVDTYVLENENDHIITGSMDAEDKEIVVHYTKDIHGTDPKHPDKGDGIPDKYQVAVHYEAEHGTVAFDRVYVTLRDEEGNFATHGSGKLRVDQIPTAIADEGYEQESASWVNKKPTIDMIITKDTTFKVVFQASKEPEKPVTPSDPEKPDTPQNPEEPDTPVTPDKPDTIPPTNGGNTVDAPQLPETTNRPIVAEQPRMPSVSDTRPFAPNIMGNTQSNGESEHVDENETPLTNGDVEVIKENVTPKAKGTEANWAIMNFICMIITVLLAILLLLSKSKNEEKLENDKTYSYDEQEDYQEEKRSLFIRSLALLLAIISIIVFFLTEDMSLPMVIIDNWTIYMLCFVIVQLIVFILGRRWKEVEQEEKQKA
ncbi:InlB B-repeat-containing protein [Longicatena caecimuris]|uniref:InlB B-repeat-containing protein n=1 Tax=Longicatena caecimuris TaxID=1796635 RepID=UPI003AB7D25F